MKHEEKINYMRIAAGIAGYGFDNRSLDMLVSLYELIIEKQGKTDLSGVCTLEEEVKKRENKRKENELSNKISDHG